MTTTDVATPPQDLEPLRAIVGDATVVGLERPAHGARELYGLSHRILDFLVRELGFRSLVIEAEWTTGLEVDAWLQTGRGALETRLEATHPWWRSQEFCDVLHWMRSHNEQHPDDPLRFTGLDVPAPDMTVLEAHLAENTLGWQRHTGHRVLFWSGSHSAVGHRRSMQWRPEDPAEGSRNAGSYLREQLGRRYRSLGMTVHSGAVRLGDADVPVSGPPASFADTLLDHPVAPHYLLDLRSPDLPVALAQDQARLRAIGPAYDPDVASCMSGAPLAEFFDAVLHVREVSPIGPPLGG